MSAYHIGIDLGGTKCVGVALRPDGVELARLEQPTPRHDYQATLAMIADLVCEIESGLKASLPEQLSPVGIGMPGSLRGDNGCVQNANSTWLNGRPFQADVEAILARPIRCANDANCFALSEAMDGAGRGAGSVFGVILGTGVGGGLVIDGQLVIGARSIGGEWGHCQLPLPMGQKIALNPSCWCGRSGCIESWLSGPALTEQYNQVADTPRTRVEEIAALALKGDAAALAVLEAHTDRLARALSIVVNIVDPEVIVFRRRAFRA